MPLQLTECCLIRDNHCNQITVFVVVEEASENAYGEQKQTREAMQHKVPDQWMNG